ncbi:HpcH/HpaI aldolase/citrate lyase family protein [Aquamicrobium segne]|uniref:HpcH/HpaI aldolase/citrate lyase family protein n=1 Tax=Aquamicrobium segne TaxID=469547 RepID=A0ABW0GYZ3_9HYPH
MPLMMRSLLLVSGAFKENLDEAFTCNADLVIVDTDAPVDCLARRPQNGGPQLYIRVHELDSGLTDADLADFIAARPDGILLPKASGGADIQQLSTKLRVQEAQHGLPDGAIAIIAMASETPAALLSGASYAGASARLTGLAWGAENLARAINAQSIYDASGHYTDVAHLARTTILLAASNAGIAAIDAAYPDWHDLEGLEADCIKARRDGFSAKLAIHPAQIPIINAVFGKDVKS